MTRRRVRGPVTDHFDGTRFRNLGQPAGRRVETDRGPLDLLRWRLTGARAAWPDRVPVVPAPRPAPRVDGPVATMVGHATVLLQLAGRNVLIDPVWSERASPVRFAGPKRHTAPGLAFDDLPPIDAVLISHNHYDHLDAATLRRLVAIHRPRIVAPLGNEALIRGIAPEAAATTGDWGDVVPLGDGLQVTLHPANHWSARTPFDRRRALWCGFVLTGAAGTVYLAGDTGYGDGRVFRDVAARFGPPLLAVLPIGAYEPRWFMRDQHANPDDAVRILLDTGARHALGVHWGTFNLTDEAREAPVEALAAACRAAGLAADRFRAFAPGERWAPPS